MRREMKIRAAALFAGLTLTMTASGAAHAGLLIKGGTTHFTSGLDKVTSAGPTWGLGYSFKPVSFVAVETGTEGSRNPVNDPDSPDTTALLRLGETTMVKFILPVLPVVHPFIGAGIALDYIMVQGGQSQFSMPIAIPGMPEQPESKYSSGMFVHFPFAAGIDFDLSAVVLGVRATYHRTATSPFPKGINPNFLDLSASIALAF